jgi:predicted DNA-binding helix-hairpin-helix protein
MIAVHSKPDVREKLSILSQDSQYDLACACGSSEADRRHRSKNDKWIYPVTLANGGQAVLFKTLISNVCVNDCKYCPLRAQRDPRRCTLTAEEIADTFLEYYRNGRVFGLFLSSAVIGDAEKTMQRLNKTAAILRRKQFKGYIHLKVIPGAGNAAIEQAVSLASAVSINIETAGQKHFSKLCASKDYLEDVISPIKLISRLTAKGSRYGKVKQTTQFVVGASDETDREIVKYGWGLYKRLGLSRIYFSAYQRGLGESCLPGELSERTNNEILTREHRLYQADWLIRKYGFGLDDICFEQNGNLLLAADPKQVWASKHPELFPVDINNADKFELLRVPGLGHITVERILKLRKQSRIGSVKSLGNPGKRLKKAQQYLKFS